MSECTCIVECSHCVEIARLTRELDEARRLHMGQAGCAAGWRARARYAREALERLIELVADDPEAKDTTTPLCVAVTVARAEVTAIEEAERRDADRSTPPLELTVREAARQRVPLDGADAQALEGALALTERERDAARDELDGIAEVLDEASVPQGADGPGGRRWTLGLGARVEHVIAERDEARAEVEELRTRTAAQLEIETRARDEARADAARLRRALEEATRALAVDPRFLSPARLGTARSILAAALAGEGEAPTCTWTQDDEGVWHTACRSSWLYPDGGSPADHRQVYCHACGQRVEAEPHAEGEDEEPAPEVKGGRDA